jgi:hypothetical protein
VSNIWNNKRERITIWLARNCIGKGVWLSSISRWWCLIKHMKWISLN